ncbi:MAG: Asp-tRNA(Asn)/Glu-tRNA(Gln) amidotransferase subunit GatB [Betaproteobacteria bacterium]
MSAIPTGWEVVIGLETHTQLMTASKIFSGSPARFGAEPNTQASAVDLALPGTLPVLNKGAVECAIKFGLAVGSTIAPRSIFARKNYFYPDLPKGYQISQYELPVVVGGEVAIVAAGAEKIVQLTRAHLEEDAGKSMHEGLDTMGVSGIDLNRAGTPLLEIVTEPCMYSTEEAVAYARALHGIVTWIGICDGNMQEGSFRCDANVSVRRAGESKLGTRCEIKNVNSFRFLERAIDYEIRRQVELIEDGGRVVQETRLYDADRDETRSMRSKEDAMDYRYFPDPDLLPLEISAAWIGEIHAGMPELPQQMRARFVAEFGLSDYDAGWLTSSLGHADYFVAALNALGGEDRRGAAKQVANWMTSDLAAALNRDDVDIAKSAVSAMSLGKLLGRIADGTLSGKMAKTVFAHMWAGEGEADDVIAAHGMKQVNDSGAIEKMVDDVIAANPKSVEEYRAGKEKALNALFGQVMKASNKTANPAQVTDMLKRKLSG